MSKLEIHSSDFRKVSAYPTKEDVCREVYDIHPNKIEGGYENKLHYLSVHFHLLREDFVRPLRDGIKAFKSPMKGDPHQKAFRIYYNILLERPRLKDGCIAEAKQPAQIHEQKLRSDLPNGKKAREFLKHGTLLCLSNDEFEENIFMAVVNSTGDPSDPEFQFTIQFTEESLDRFFDGAIISKEFTALEPTAYFESYNHTLTGLQNLANLPSLPMEQYIVGCCKSEPVLPSYMEKVVNFQLCNTVESFQSKEDIKQCVSLVKEKLKMNHSQSVAYISALTQKFSVIQGPPGTGKTYVGLCIVRTLLCNFYITVPGRGQSLYRPILVVCYTNHALDQFLEGILKFLNASDLIRIGDRCKSEKVEECNIKNKDYKFHEEIFKARQELNDMKQEISEKAGNILEALEPCKKTLLYHTVVGFITNPSHQKQFHEMGKEILNESGYAEEYSIWVWLDQVNFSEDFFPDMPKLLKSYRNKLKPMTKEEALKVADIRALNHADRWRLYFYYLHQYEEGIKRNYRKCLLNYQQCYEKLKEISQFKNSEILKRAKVVGVTTTGAAKHQKALNRLQSPIVIVEEAAEVLEAHLLTSISSECQHLILIGDHQQLRPSTSDNEIGTRYKLEISLFERMVKNGFPFKKLKIQHRMRPEISALVRHVYGTLRDHESVKDRTKIRGLMVPVLLFNHSAKESFRENSTSKSNEFEADMILQLVRLLIKEQYEPRQITVISMYGEQLFLLNKLLQGSGVLVTTVDNYQGEENDIIILSTVRNNDRNELGFVAVDNRICVALSRAKHGLFALGNFDMLRKNSDLWEKVVQTAYANGMLSNKFVLSCHLHGPITSVSTPEEFKSKMFRECKKVCETQLPCSHYCTRKCHIYEDQDHKVFKCESQCTKVLSCGHKCTGICSEPCPPCRAEKPFNLPCGHTQYAACSSRIEKINCKNVCERIMKCGHPCQQKCYQKCDPNRCIEGSDTLCILCNAPCVAPCKGKEYWACSRQCSATLVCGHRCTGTCQDCLL